MDDPTQSSEFVSMERIQYEDIYHEDDVPLADVRTNALRLLVYFGTVLVLLMLVSGFVVKLSRQLTYEFVFKGDRQEFNYRFIDAVYLEDTYVEVGRVVAPTDPLVRISSPEIVAFITAYENAKTRRQIFIDTEYAVFQNQIEALGLEAAKLDENIRDFEEQKALGWRVYEQERAEQEYIVEQARIRFDREQALFEKQVISEERLQEVEEIKIRGESRLATMAENRRRDTASIDTQINLARLEKEIVLRQKAEKGAVLLNMEALQDYDIEETYQNLRRNFGDFEVSDGSLILKPSFTGTISYLTDLERTVPSGTILLKILRNPSLLYASATIPPLSIGLVDVEDPVVLKVATFPHWEWGALEGRIRHLSLTPDESGQYPVEIEVENEGRLSGLLQIGMTGQASILVEERSFFSYIVSKVEENYFNLVE